MAKSPSKIVIWPVLAFLPASAVTVGLLAWVMLLKVPSAAGREFLDVFISYALRLPGDPNLLRWAAPALGLVLLTLLSVALRSSRPLITIVPVRVLLLTLIAVLTILVRIFSVVIPLTPSSGVEGGFEAVAPLTAYLFLFMDVDLCLVFLATFLPVYRGLRKPPVSPRDN